MSKRDAGKLRVVPRAEPTEWERIVSDFEASMKAGGLSFRTVEHYSDILNRVLLGYCTRNGIEPAALTKRDLERLSAELFDAGRSRQSVKTYMAAINRFLKWCSQEEGMASLRGPEPRVERRILDVLTREEIAAIEAAAVTERDKLIVRVLADTGIRVGELRSLRVGDLVADGRERYLRILGRGQGGGAKGDSSRLVPITPALYMRLDRYVRLGPARLQHGHAVRDPLVGSHMVWMDRHCSSSTGRGGVGNARYLVVLLAATGSRPRSSWDATAHSHSSIAPIGLTASSNESPNWSRTASVVPRLVDLPEKNRDAVLRLHPTATASCSMESKLAGHLAADERLTAEPQVEAVHRIAVPGDDLSRLPVAAHGMIRHDDGPCLSHRRPTRTSVRMHLRARPLMSRPTNEIDHSVHPHG